MKRVLTVLFLGMVFTAICAAQSPNANFTDFTESGPATQSLDSDDLAARHARLPRGTMVQVTNDDTGAQVVVEITGRIPPSGSRIIDLSAEAALKLGLGPDEIPQVTIAVVTEDEAPAAPPPVAAAPAPEPEPPTVFYDDSEPIVFNYDDIYGGEPVIVYDDTPAPVVEAPPPAPVVVAAPPPPEPAPVAEAPPPAPPPSEPASAPVYTPPAPAYPVYTPPPRAPVYTPPAAPANPYYYPENRPQPQEPAPNWYTAPAARIIPRAPDPASFKVYRVQVGAFKAARNAKDVFDRLVTAGFSPAFESYGDLFRVVISGIRAQDIQTIAQRLGNAGFTEAWIREEL
jgi:rare lipoprotein A